jgi:hypothetical protein
MSRHEGNRRRLLSMINPIPDAAAAEGSPSARPMTLDDERKEFIIRQGMGIQR